MYPVGDGDLTSFLELDRKGLPPSQVEKHSQWIKKWFFCLSSALAYLHSQRMIHEDIKPSNIIHRGEQIYFTDFGSCRRISPGDDTSTESPALVTRLFAAPEALISDNGEFTRHGSKSDVFSLGLVFIEMFTILTGRTVDQLRVSISDPNQAQLQYHQYIHRFEYWFKLYKYHPIDRPQSWAIILYDECLHFMVRADRKTRPTARQVVRMLESYSGFRESISCECHRSEAYLEEYMGMDDDEGKSNKDHGGQERSTEEDMDWEIEYDYLEAMAF